MTQDSVQTTTFRRELAGMQTRLTANPHDRAAEMEVERLEKRIAVSEQHDQRVAPIEADREADARQREAQAAADLEAELRRSYTDAMPGDVTDDAWRLVRESVLHKHRLSQMDARDREVAKARASGSYSI